MCEKNFILQGQVKENTELIKDIYQMKLEYPKELVGNIKPGQYLNVYLAREDLLLPRPISVSRADSGSGQEVGYGSDKGTVSLVYKVVGAGTGQMALYKPGESVKLSLPLGNGYDLSQKPKEAWLVGGGLGLPPLLELAYKLKEAGTFLNIVLGYRDEPFLIDEFAGLLAEGPGERAGESPAGPAGKLFIVSEEKGYGIKGNVMDVLKEELAGNSLESDSGIPAASVFASGPLPMLEAVSNYCEEKDLDIQVSLEERMACGFGACLGCVRKIKEGDKIVSKRVCKDGPVFDGRKVVWHD